MKNPAPFLTICAPAELNETPIGYVWRMVHSDARMRVKGTASSLVDRQVIQPPWIVASSLRLLCERLDPVFSSPQMMLDKHTCLPALLPFVRADRLAMVLGHVIEGERHPGIASSLGLAHKATKSRASMAMCTECAHEDLRSLGFAYWRREHSLPGLTVCPRHMVPLVAGCGDCAFSQPLSRQPRLPQLKCWCGQRHRKVRSHSTPVIQTLGEMARYASELLASPRAAGHPQHFGAYYQACALASGYAAGLHWKTPAICDDLSRKYPQELLDALNASIKGPQNWVSACFASGVAPLGLGRNLLLLDFFGRKVPGELEVQAAIQNIASYRRSRTPAKCKLSPVYDRQASRQRILDYLRAHMGAGRQQLLRDLSTDALRARRYDAAWYDLACPVKPSMLGRWARSQKKLTHENADQRAVAHVRKRHAALLNHPGRPKRVTRRALLAGLPCENTTGKDQLGHMPRTRGALYWRVESDAQGRERYARWILRELKGDPKRVERAARRTGLTISQVDALTASIELGEA